ncbi:hypothetical protein G647_08001 [Cladophialophora carrionii CBS 160.54]|uniref:Apoptosis regulator Bcl-2 family BH4 domain-containing protein n=1 Tax=Cladophialophora carrionii CBS 160.54 TaxID=1279043 RepID=V9D419_9EURO|nr:uncharacterized protein G647_08001 [Cladophialophora carrionii CBS 160.54]ETI21654.1 hypothetical protein G647_08001 [Cladophialophora carrionii CBS 160.54]
MEPPPPPDHHFAPIDPHIEPLHDFVEDRFVDDHIHYEERIPNVQQRLDRLSLDGDVPETRPRAERLRSADTLPLPQDYLYYRLSKRGDDWSSCVKKPIPAPIDEIERKAKRSKGGDAPILEQLTKMPSLRRDMLDEVVRKANDKESGDAYWEVVYIKSKRVQTRRGKMEVPEMDVILARTRGRAKSRTKSFANSGERVKREVVKEKQYINDSYGRARKDSVMDKLEDPVANLPVFEADGRPRDDLGPIHFNNSNLPPHIAREMPLGTKLEKKKEKAEKRRSRSRSKSRDRGVVHHEDGVFVVPDVHDFAGESADPATVDGMLGDEPMDRRGRRGQSPHEHPVVVEEDPRRSHSRHRPDGRSKSRPRKESVHFPNGRTRQYFDEGDGSSENSDTSHYGFVGEYESSTTSISTPGAIPRRGSLARGGRPDVEYKKHHPGPNRRLSYQEKSYHGEQHVILPARPARRNSNAIYHDRPPEGRYERPYSRLVRRETAPPIPEDHQIVYHEPLPRTSERDLVPLRRSYTAREPILHHHPRDDEELYYRDEVDRQSYRAEGYQRDRVIEDHFNRREQELSARERELEIREDELRQLRRQRERELDRDREYYDDRDVRKERRESRQIFFDPKTGQAYYYND